MGFDEFIQRSEDVYSSLRENNHQFREILDIQKKIETDLYNLKKHYAKLKSLRQLYGYDEVP